MPLNLDFENDTIDVLIELEIGFIESIKGLHEL